MDFEKSKAAIEKFKKVDQELLEVKRLLGDEIRKTVGIPKMAKILGFKTRRSLQQRIDQPQNFTVGEVETILQKIKEYHKLFND